MFIIKLLSLLGDARESGAPSFFIYVWVITTERRKMAKNKPRTAVNRKVNKLLLKFGKECEWWDDGYPECMLPWSNKNENGYNGNPFICKKLYHKYLASVDKPSQTIVDEFNRRK